MQLVITLHKFYVGMVYTTVRKSTNKLHTSFIWQKNLGRIFTGIYTKSTRTSVTKNKSIGIIPGHEFFMENSCHTYRTSSCFIYQRLQNTAGYISYIQTFPVYISCIIPNSLYYDWSCWFFTVLFCKT